MCCPSILEARNFHLSAQSIMPDHQSGKLKQTNKKHKGRTSKRFQKESFGAGKVASRKGAASSNYARDLVR